MTGGRCHGPDCINPALIKGGFCSEVCQARWHSQFDEQARRRALVQQSLVEDRLLREAAAQLFQTLDEAIERTAPRPEPHPTQADLTAALTVAERVREESERPRQLDQLRLHSLSFSDQPSPFLAAAVEEAAPEVRRAVDAAIEQALADIHTDVRPQIAHGDPGAIVDDIRRAYELIRDVEPPEPVKLTREQRDILRAASYPTPNAVAYWQNGSLGDITAIPIELVDSVEESTPYLEQRKQLQQALRGSGPGEAARGKLPVSSGATNPQVASEDPQVGFLSKWINRLGLRWWPKEARDDR